MKVEREAIDRTQNTLNLAPELWAAFQYDLNKLSADTEVIQGGMSCQEVLKAHYVICDYFYNLEDETRRQGALIGLRDENLFCSAIARQHVEFCGRVKWNSPYEVGASLFFGLVKNHPFHDGNKRTAFLSLVWFLRKAGIGFKVRPDVLNKMTVAVASSNWEFFARYNFKRLEGDVGHNDAIIMAIAAFLRECTRQRVKKYKAVRWSEFERALKKFGFFFGAPNRDKISIFKYQKGKILGLPLGKSEKKVVMTVSYPGAKRQISAQSIKSILRKLGLNDPKLYDYSSIFDDEPMYCLVQEYEDLIEKLQDE